MTVESVFEKISGYMADESLMCTLITAFVICLGFFLLAGLLRLISGKRGTAVGAITASLDIVILYVLVTLLPLCVPSISQYLPALPFCSCLGGNITLMAIPELTRDILCTQLLDLLIIAFLFGLGEALLPEGKNLFVCLFLRIMTLVLVGAVILLVDFVSGSLFPDFVQTYAPILLLAFVALLLAATVFKWLFGLILGMSCGPVIGAIYTFVVGNLIGKQLAKAALTCILIAGLLLLAYRQNIHVIALADLPGLILGLSVSAPVIARYLISKLY